MPTKICIFIIGRNKPIQNRYLKSSPALGQKKKNLPLNQIFCDLSRITNKKKTDVLINWFSDIHGMTIFIQYFIFSLSVQTKKTNMKILIITSFWFTHVQASAGDRGTPGNIDRMWFYFPSQKWNLLAQFWAKLKFLFSMGRIRPSLTSVRN